MASTMLPLKKRLISLEEDFLAAIMAGQDAMAAFEGRFIATMEDVDRAIESESLDLETTSLAHRVASRCATLADTSIDIFATCDSVTTQLVSQIDSLMSELTIHGISSIPPASYLSSPTSPDASKPGLSRKRRRCSEEVVHDSEDCMRKRRREWRASCPAPQPPTDAPAPPLPLLSAVVSPSPATTPAHDHNYARRKRRLSDVDCPDLARSVKRLYAGPRLHAVSDSYPVLSKVLADSWKHSSRTESDLHLEPFYGSSTFNGQPWSPSNGECIVDEDTSLSHLNLSLGMQLPSSPFLHAAGTDPLPVLHFSSTCDTLRPEMVPISAPLAVHTCDSVYYPSPEHWSPSDDGLTMSPGSTPSPSITPSPSTPLGTTFQLAPPLYQWHPTESASTCDTGFTLLDGLEPFALDGTGYVQPPSIAGGLDITSDWSSLFDSLESLVELPIPPPPYYAPAQQCESVYVKSLATLPSSEDNAIEFLAFDDADLVALDSRCLTGTSQG